MKWEMATSDLTNQSKKLVSEGYFLCIIIVLELIVVSTVESAIVPHNSAHAIIFCP